MTTDNDGTDNDDMRALRTSPTVDVECAARLLHIGRAHAYRLAKRGKLPGAIRLGHSIRVSSAALRKLLDIADPPTPEPEAAEAPGS